MTTYIKEAWNFGSTITCPHCFYNTRPKAKGGEVTTCPMCGEEFRVSLLYEPVEFAMHKLGIMQGWQGKAGG